jgi:hypothetical protein
MPDPEQLLHDLAGAVLDGTPIDWQAAAAAAGPTGEAFVRDLRMLASVAGVHRDDRRRCAVRKIAAIRKEP